MRDFFLANASWVVVVSAAVNLVFIIIFLKSYFKQKKPILLCMALLSFGLFYDGLIIFLGNTLNGSGLFVPLSQIRFISHGGLIPLVFPICAYALTKSKKVITAVWIFTIVIIGLGLAEGFCTVLELREFAGIARYVSAEATPVWAGMVSRLLSFGTVIPLMAAGIAVWIKQKTPTLFLSGFLMFAFSALGPLPETVI